MNKSSWYIVEGKGIKPHYCNTYMLAKNVGDNLKKRNVVEHFIVSAKETCLFDDKKTFEFKLNDGKEEYAYAHIVKTPDFALMVQMDNLSVFKQALAEPMDKYDGLFGKIHDAEKVLCLEASEIASLKQNFV